jgi:mannitol/fructose-specific phosphotransferase system IIA component (Ntr-type)
VDHPPALITQPDAVVLDLMATSREATIVALHERLAALPAVHDAAGLLHDLLERAQLSTVCIAEDVAMPHARSNAVGRMVLAVGRMAGGVAFDGAHPAVRLVFLIGAPAGSVMEYLQLVAGLVRLLKAPGVRDGLLAAKTEEEFRAWLARGAAA